MNDLIQRHLQKVTRYIRNDKTVSMLLQMSLAFSAMGFMVLLYYMRRRNRYVLVYNSNNIGFLGLIKHDINRTQYSSKKVFDSIIKRNFSYPNGITNFGNNCYINVLLHVYTLS
jgi:hypothetical protein